MSNLRIDETCACGASIIVDGDPYRQDSNPRNPRGAEEVVERWRSDHHHEESPMAENTTLQGEVIP